MLAIRCNNWMPYEQLEIEDIPIPEPAPGQVRIAVHAAGMSFATSLVTQGRYQRKPPLPFTPGTEIAGAIDALGQGVDGFAVGERVCAGIDWGGHAEFAVTDVATVYSIPDSLPFEVAPQFPLSYGTSYAALAWRAALQPGETLLVHGAAGAVGLAAVEFGKAMGATVIATASSVEKRDLARAHGADHTVAVPSADALDEIRAIAPRGADVVFDPIGGDVFDLSLRCVANSGRILVIGFAGGRVQQIPANHLLVKDVAALGFNYGNYIGWGRTDERKRHEPRLRAAMRQMFAWYEQGQLKPVTSHRFPLRDYREAMATVLGRKSMGKVVLAMPIGGTNASTALPDAGP
jgi:NADPH2:quinone reductase